MEYYDRINTLVQSRTCSVTPFTAKITLVLDAEELTMVYDWYVKHLFNADMTNKYRDVCNRDFLDRAEIIQISEGGAVPNYLLLVPHVKPYGLGSGYLVPTSDITRLCAEVTVDIFRRIGHDPSDGSVMFGHVVANLVFQMMVKLTNHYDGDIAMVSEVMKKLDGHLTPDVRDVASQLSPLQVSSALLRVYHESQEGFIKHAGKTWSATTQF